MAQVASSELKPALVLGSGFHRHVFGDGHHTVARPLYDWHYLVTQTSQRLQVAITSDILTPIQRWETLILRSMADGYKDQKGNWISRNTYRANVVEKEARQVVANIINEASMDYPQSVRAQIPLLEYWGSVISLNFDTAWLPLNANTIAWWNSSLKVNKLECKRLSQNRLIVGVDGGEYRRVWYPNGSSFEPGTIRMGLHDYGSAPHSVRIAFYYLKRWERKNRIGNKNPVQQIAGCAAMLRKASEGVRNLDDFIMDQPQPSSFPLTWVADFLYRPLVIAGVGLSDQESGLWWLLAQRARNIARTGIPAKVYILVSDKDRPEFWRSKPFGIEPIVCKNWDEGWERLLLMSGAFCDPVR